MVNKLHLRLLSGDDHAITKGKLPYTKRRITEVANELKSLSSLSEDTNALHSKGFSIRRPSPFCHFNLDDAVIVIKTFLSLLAARFLKSKRLV